MFHHLLEPHLSDIRTHLVTSCTPDIKKRQNFKEEENKAKI